MSDTEAQAFPEREFRAARFEQFRLLTLGLAAVSVVLSAALWAWDHSIDPAGATDTVGHRVAMGLALVPVVIAILSRAPLAGVAVALYGGMLAIEALFIDLLGHLRSGAVHGMGGFVYVFLAVPLLSFGLPARWCVAALAGLLLAPLVLALPGGPLPLPGFDPSHYLLLFAPALGVVVLALLVIERILRQAHALRRLLEVRTLAMDRAAEAVVITDVTGRIEYTNPAFTAMTGYAAAEALGQNPRILRSGRQAPDVYRDLWRTILRGEIWRGELENLRKDGVIYREEMSIAPLLGPDGRPRHFVAVKRDVTHQRELEARLQHLAHHDPLTGLPNRVLFLDRLGQALREANRSAERVGLLFVDLDGFKDVNDTHGHEVGDAVLREVARRLTEALRDADTVGRMGGDEFTVLVRDLRAVANASRVAEKLLHALRSPIVIQGRRCPIGASIGVAVYPDDGSDLDALLAAADAAMYDVKHRGKHGHSRSRELPAVRPRAASSQGI